MTWTVLGTGPAAPAAGQPRAEPSCNYLDDSARPVVRERPPDAQPRGAVPQVQCLIKTYSNLVDPPAVDGILGPRTRAAIRAVQRCNRVSEATGVLVGPATWEVLYAPMPNCARPRPS
ncbi:peptidoglycan-binding domain-containing protein [Streptomyces sp. NPDC041068]|uniref:peptidoglycan-binding domain-containing protein n=1 Tax=Streptomyces sp. NPDC041068 TaxID=3155130 RepID=UPI003409E079